MLALQIGRLPVFPGEGDHVIVQCHQDASVFDLDLSLKVRAIRGDADPADYQALKVWRLLMHEFLMPGCSSRRGSPSRRAGPLSLGTMVTIC